MSLAGKNTTKEDDSSSRLLLLTSLLKIQSFDSDLL